MNLPNIITVFRIILIPFVIQRFAVGDVRLATILFLVACASDILDGFIARKFHLVTDVGKLLDPFADKAMSLSVLICMWYFNGLIPAWAVIVFLSKELLLLVGGLILLKNEIIIPANKFGKVSTVITSLVVISILLGYQIIPTGVQQAMIVVATAVTLLALVVYFSMFVQSLRSKK